MRFPRIISYLFISLIRSTKKQVVKNYYQNPGKVLLASFITKHLRTIYIVIKIIALSRRVTSARGLGDF